MLGGRGEVRILAVAGQALFLRKLELRERHEIALTDRRNDLVEEVGHRLRVTGLTRDVDEIVIMGKEFGGFPRADIRLHNVTPPAVVGTLTDFVETG
jgi:hypothetical protein